MVFVAVIAVSAATVAWLCLRRVGTRTAPGFVDMVVVLTMSLAAALSVGGPAL